MHMLTRIAAILSIVALPTAGSLAGAPAQAARSEVVGHLYVNDNTAPLNTVAGFARHADGTLSPLPGSPFVVGGSGAGVVTGSQGALQVSSDGRYLLAADPGSDQISVLRIRRDGRLRTVEDSPISSGGSQPISIAVHGDLVYVANSGAADANYTGFTLNEGGHLTPLASSTFDLPAGSGPGDVLFNADGTHLAGTRVNTSLIDSFAVGADGHLTAAPNSPYSAQASGPFGSAFRPTDPAQLFVSNAHGGSGAGSVSAYSVAGDGTLTSIGASPYADLQTAPCWVAIAPDGQHLFTVNTGSNTISSYTIAANGTLTLLGSTPLKGAPGLRPFDIQVDPTGTFLYVVDAARDAVSAFSVNGGTLTELPSSPIALPTGATPFGIVVN